MRRTGQHLLLVDSVGPRRAELCRSLDAAGYVAVGLGQGPAVDAHLTSYRPDLALVTLDDAAYALELVGALRAASELPVLVLVTSGALEDRLAAFDAGADDCLDVPYELAELLARIAALLRRSQASAVTVLRVGDLTVDPASTTVARAGQPLDLTPKEFALLVALAERAGQLQHVASLRARIWPDASGDGIVHTHISTLRRKLEAHGPRMVHSIRGSGYVIRAD